MSDTLFRVDNRRRAGMFLAFQCPQEAASVSVIQFLRQALSQRKGIDLLDEVTPDRIHILVKGHMVASGDMELAEQLERDGYDAFNDVAAGGAGEAGA